MKISMICIPLGIAIRRKDQLEHLFLILLSLAVWLFFFVETDWYITKCDTNMCRCDIFVKNFSFSFFQPSGEHLQT